eukprot:SAG25_NODE_171_length_13027_cov_80.469833_7_plen_74_part_00
MSLVHVHTPVGVRASDHHDDAAADQHAVRHVVHVVAVTIVRSGHVGRGKCATIAAPQDTDALTAELAQPEARS